MAQANTTKKTFNKKPLAIAVGTALMILLGMGIWTKSTQKTAEEQAAISNARERPSEISNVQSDSNELKHEAQGEEREKINQAEKAELENSRENGESYVGLQPNREKDAEQAVGSEATLLQAPTDTPAPVEAPVQPVAQPQPQVVYVQAPPVEPVIPEQKVYVVTERKEIPVKRYETYNVSKDTDVLRHFATMYGANLGNGMSAVSGRGQVNMGGNQGQNLTGFEDTNKSKKSFALKYKGGGVNGDGSGAGSGSANGSAQVGGPDSRRDAFDALSGIQGQEQNANYGKDNRGQGGETSANGGVNANGSSSASANASSTGSNGNSSTAMNNKRDSSKQISNEPVAVYKIGDIVAAELETFIDSRQPSLVRARIAEGPLEGAIVVGSFSKNGDGTALMIQFTHVNVLGLSRSIPIQAVAVDLVSGSNAMASSVNRHAVARVSYTMVQTLATAFAQNLANNNQNTVQRTTVDANGNTTTMNELTTIKKTNKEIWRESGAAGVSASLTELNDLIPTTPTVKVKPMPFGLFITNDLIFSAKDAAEVGADF